jgi:Fe2+ transport system protein FeoA
MSSTQLIKGHVYRIMGFIVDCRQKRSRLVALGFIPGVEIECITSWFFGKYWLICIGTQCYGMSHQELALLRLHVINYD